MKRKTKLFCHAAVGELDQRQAGVSSERAANISIIKSSETSCWSTGTANTGRIRLPLQLQVVPVAPVDIFTP